MHQKQIRYFSIYGAEKFNMDILKVTFLGILGSEESLVVVYTLNQFCDVYTDTIATSEALSHPNVKKISIITCYFIHHDDSIILWTNHAQFKMKNEFDIFRIFRT